MSDTDSDKAPQTGAADIRRRALYRPNLAPTDVGGYFAARRALSEKIRTKGVDDLRILW